MTDSTVRAVRLDTPLDAVSFDSLVRSNDAVSLLVAPLSAESNAAWSALSTAHLYHIASAKDDIPRHFYAEAEPTWKMGIRFLWGPRKEFFYTFSYEFEKRLPELTR